MPGSSVRARLSSHDHQILEEAIDQAALMPAHLFLSLAGVLISISDGFNLSALSFAIPSIIPEMHLTSTQAGAALSAALFGAMLGGVAAARLESLCGRRLLFCLSLLWLGLGSLATSRVGSFQGLWIARAVTGISLGAPIPVLMAMMGDSIPRSIRARAYALCVSGVPIGGVLASFTSVQLGRSLGWQAIFWIGFLLPLLMVPAVLAAVREPLARVIVGDEPFAAKERTFAKLGVSLGILHQLQRNERQNCTEASGGNYSALFKPGRLPQTLATLLSVFLSSALVYFLINWVPALLSRSGHALGQDALGGGFLSGGMIVAALTFGYMIDKFGVLKISGVAFLVAAPVLLALGDRLGRGDGVNLLLMFAGMLALGSQLGCTLLSVTAFPVQMRLAAATLTYVTTRLGATVSPYIVGRLLQANASSSDIFELSSGVSIAAAAAILLAVVAAGKPLGASAISRQVAGSIRQKRQSGI